MSLLYLLSIKGSLSDFLNRSQFNPKYSVTLSESASDMFPNYQAPDSLVMIEAQLGPGGGKLKSSTELKRKNSVKSVKSVRCEKHPLVTAGAITSHPA